MSMKSFALGTPLLIAGSIALALSAPLTASALAFGIASRRRRKVGA